MSSPQRAPVTLPRVAITFCTQCRWMLRAAYFAQELLSTFGNQIGEVALIPATGGLFQVELTYLPNHAQDSQVQKVLVWDRKTQGGFPETKVLKQLVRNHIDPTKHLGHSDTHGKKIIEDNGESNAGARETAAVKRDAGESVEVKRNPDGSICEDCI